MAPWKITAQVETRTNIEIEDENQMHPGIMELRFYAAGKFCCHQMSSNWLDWEHKRKKGPIFKDIVQRRGIC